LFHHRKLDACQSYSAYHDPGKDKEGWCAGLFGQWCISRTRIGAPSKAYIEIRMAPNDWRARGKAATGTHIT
jgi:hypothetical protein